GGAWLTMPSGSTADLNAVWGSDPNNVFAVGAGGTILHFDGTQWSAMTSNTTATLFGVWGSAPNVVFAVGAAGMIVRFNGTSWTPTTESTYELHGISGTSSLVLAVGKSGTVLRYDGASWTRMTTPGSSHIYAVLVRGSNAFAVGQNGTVWRLDSTGWNNLPQTLTTYDLLSIWSSSDTDVFIGGGYGRLLHYDGTFVEHDPGSARSITGLWGVSPDHVFGVTQGGTVQEYTGSRWVMQSAAGSTIELTRIVRFDNGHALAIGHNSVVAQFNGTTWATKTITNTNWLRSIWAKDEQTVLIAGDDSSGGDSGVYVGNFAAGFTRVLSNGPLAVWGSSNGEIWAAGNASLIWKASLTAPSNWTMTYGTTSSSLPDFRAMWGSSPSDIFAVGDLGTIVHYDGVSWSAMPTPTTLELDDVWGSASDNVIAVGEQGVILHYNGVAWRRMSSGTGENLASISGTGPSDVWIAATNNTILHFDGVSWSRVEPGEPGDFRGVAASPRAYMFVGMAGAHHRIERVCAAREDRCGNAWDDDCDGLINCADPDCAGASECARGGACPRVADVSCGSDIRGSTFTGIGRIDELRCSSHSTAGPEAAYRFTAPASGTTTVSLSELTTDLDVSITGAFEVSGACDLGTCIAASAVSGAAKSVTFDAVANVTYYIVVDGPIDTAGDFRLGVSCP
ncbi:MAG TPA: PPC domain-containing protein, partial [Kofleriaceae bacterium]